MLGLAVFGETAGAQLTADAGLSEAAPFRLRQIGMEVVDPDGAVPQQAGDPPGPVFVGGPHRSGEAVLGVVGEGDGLFLRAEGLHGEDGAEDLLADDAHAAVAPVEDRGPEEVAGAGRPAAARAQDRALGEGGGHVRLGPCQLAR